MQIKEQGHPRGDFYGRNIKIEWLYDFETDPFLANVPMLYLLKTPEN